MSLLNLRILIVDDDLHYLDKLTKYLQNRDHAVFTAEDEDTVRRIVQSQKDKMQPIDLAFIDFVLPNSDGIAISHILKEIDPELFRVGLTEHDKPEIFKKLILEGSFALIISKFDDETETIDRVLGTAYAGKSERNKH